MNDHLLAPITPVDEIAWATAMLRFHAPKIGSFLSRAIEFEAHILTGNFTGCANVLDSVEAETGTSLWSIEARIALLQAAEGLEGQKAYLKGIRESRAQELVKFIAYYASNRNETTTNPRQFEPQLLENIQSWDPDEPFRSYLTYRLVDRCHCDVRTYANILRYEATSAIVDYYETYVRLAQKAVISGNLPVEYIAGLRDLALRLQDPRISKILLLAGVDGQRTDGLQLQRLDQYDLFVQGRHVTPQGALTSDPADVSLWLL